MGCDIHAYIEFSQKPQNEDEKHTDSQNFKAYWHNFSERIRLGRNYLFFALMANVRNYDRTPVLFEPRGLPEDLAYFTECDSRMYISDSKEENCVTLERANQWVNAGYSKFINLNDKPTWVTNPDWHSHSWLNTQEFQTVLENAGTSASDDPEYHAALACMQKLEELGNNVRLVFWFDN